MTDRREQILAKLETILAAVPDIKAFVRNRDQLPDAKRPAILLLDGDEEGKRSADGRGRIGASPNLVILKPEIYFALEDRKPQNENVGPDSNVLRAAILKAILNDVSLTGLCENVFYAGCVTDLAKGREMAGQMGIAIEFTYYLQPKDL